MFPYWIKTIFKLLQFSLKYCPLSLLLSHSKRFVPECKYTTVFIFIRDNILDLRSTKSGSSFSPSYCSWTSRYNGSSRCSWGRRISSCCISWRCTILWKSLSWCLWFLRFPILLIICWLCIDFSWHFSYFS